MSEFIVAVFIGMSAWLLFTGNHIYITNHLVHVIFPKNFADKITKFFRSLP